MEIPVSQTIFTKIFFMIKEMSATAYADLIGVAKGTVCKWMAKGRLLPGVIGTKRFNRLFVLTVDIKAAKKTLKKVA